MYYARPTRTRTGLGIVPAIAGAVALEAAWAWYDPDVFMDLWWEADQEQQVTNLNNWWASLEKTGRATLAVTDPAWIQLDGSVAAWVQWQDEYKSAIARRWMPGGRDWDDELEVWFVRFRETSNRVAIAGGERAVRMIEGAGIDERMLPQVDQGIIDEVQQAAQSILQQAGQSAEQAGRGAGKGVGAGFFWPAIALGASAGLLIWLANSPQRRKRTAA